MHAFYRQDARHQSPSDCKCRAVRVSRKSTSLFFAYLEEQEILDLEEQEILKANAANVSFLCEARFVPQEAIYRRKVGFQASITCSHAQSPCHDLPGRTHASNGCRHITSWRSCELQHCGIPLPTQRTWQHPRLYTLLLHHLKQCLESTDRFNHSGGRELSVDAARGW